MTNYTQWKSLVDLHEYSAIPDSVVLQYAGDTYTTGDANWTDDTDTASMSLVGDPQSTTLSDGSDSVAFDGVDDYGLIPFPPELEGSSLQTLSFEWAFQTTDSSGNLTGIFETDNQAIQIAVDSGLEVIFRDEDSELRFESSTSVTLNDGNRHDLTVAMDGPNEDALVIVDGVEESVTYSTQNSLDNFGTWDNDFAHAARQRADGDIDNKIQLNTGAIRWHNEQITSQTIDDYPF